MSAIAFRGVFTALVTPFRDGAVDEAAFVALVERQIAGGVHGLVPVGTTGETATLSHDEHRRVVELCVETAAGRVPVIAGAGSNSTAEAIELAAPRQGGRRRRGAWWSRPTTTARARRASTPTTRRSTTAVDLPVLVYNVPSRTGVDISNETLARLAKLPNIVGIKDATGDLRARQPAAADLRGEDWVMLSGDDPTALGYMAHGGHGCISVTSNVAPGPAPPSTTPAWPATGPPPWRCRTG